MKIWVVSMSDHTSNKNAALCKIKDTIIYKNIGKVHCITQGLRNIGNTLNYFAPFSENHRNH